MKHNLDVRGEGDFSQSETKQDSDEILQQIWSR